MGFAEHEIQSGACLSSRLEGKNQALPSNQTLKLHLEWALGMGAFVELAAVVPQGCVVMSAPPRALSYQPV